MGLWVCAVAAVAQCSSEVAQTEILLRIGSTVEVDQLVLTARNIAGGEEGTDSITRDLEGRSLVDEPYGVLVRPSRIAVVGEEFLIYAQGLEDGVVRVSKGGLFSFVEGQRVEAELVMDELTASCDADTDGFADCRCELDDDQLAICDCNDQNGEVNVFTLEDCDDTFDNNCSGYPPNEGCVCTTDQPCTTLAESLWSLAGVGECRLGVLRCSGGVLSEVCEGAGEPGNQDIPDNGLDDDCDGTVDEGSNCSIGESRSCFLGLVDADGCVVGDPGAPCEATERAVGLCQTGTQSCDGSWGDCVGETRPQRVPGGVGWVELADQCDGLDNDCDGEVDEQPDHDTDGDGFRFCGTCLPGRGACGTFCDAPPASGSVPWLCDATIDCDDSALGVNPDAVEDCTTALDDDCRCDHDPGLGLPTNVVGGGTNCAQQLSTLDCGRPVRADPTPHGTCADTLGGSSPYYAGYFPANSTGNCVFCNKVYGRTCNPDTGRCTTKDEDCGTGCTTIGAVAEARPTCCVGAAATCTGTVAPEWVCDFGVDPNNECPPQTCDDLDPALTPTGPFFWNLDDDDGDGFPLCYFRQDVPGMCEGEDTCRTRAAECQDALRGRVADGIYARPICTVPSAGCRDEALPEYDGRVPAGLDPYGDCVDDGTTCAGNATCYRVVGETCGGAGDVCAPGSFCVDGYCCASNGCGDCERCDVSGSEGTCTGITNTDGNNCVDDCTHCVSGTCTPRLAGDFAECGATSDCQACTTNGGNCGNYTGNAGTNCSNSDTFCCSGTCVNPPNTPSELAGPCGAGICGGGVWQCAGSNFQCSTQGTPCESCSGDSEVAGTCQADGSCGSGSSTECAACTTCTETSGVTSCTAVGYDVASEDTTGATQRCEGNFSCDGGGNCELDDGQPCSAGTQCVSNSCVDNTCCASSTCGTCERCDTVGSPGVCTGITSNDGRGCSTACTRCASGACTDRPAGDFTECGGTCQACLTAGGTCGAVSQADASACIGSDTFCCAGACVNPPNSPSELAASCGAGDCGGGVWRCNAAAFECSSINTFCESCTGDVGAKNARCLADGTCGAGTPTECPACQTCSDPGDVTTCAPLTPAGVLDTAGSNTCSDATNPDRACDGLGACKLADGELCPGGNNDCASGHCVDGVCCNVAACGTCRRCDVAGLEGSCQPFDAPNGVNCTDDCNHCLAGACVNRTAGDFAECTGTCRACTTAGGDCGPYTGADGTNCDPDNDTYCCAGTCVDPLAGASEFGAACGGTGCVGTWTCSGTVGQCSTTGQSCESCSSNDVAVTGRVCLGNGSCTAGTSGECPTCRTCVDAGNTVSCDPQESAGTPDLEGTLTCAGTQRCDGAGSCLAHVGQACTDGDDCAQGNCVDLTCCTTATCAPNATCANAAGTCRLEDGEACTADGNCNSGNCYPDPGFCCTSATCAANETCDSGSCLLIDGEACLTDVDCDSGFCAPDPGFCCDNASCGANQTCASGSCLLIDGETCAGAAACDSGNCVDVTCCQESACSTGETCATADGSCKKLEGELCAIDDDCLDDRCVTDTAGLLRCAGVGTCSLDDGSQAPTTWVECNGNTPMTCDGLTGAWTSATACTPSQCDPGGESAVCGYTDVCVSDLEAFGGGCDPTCVDCGRYQSLTNGTGCAAATVTSCNATCGDGVECVAGQTQLAGRYCSATTEFVINRLDACGNACTFVDDGATGDSNNVDCAACGGTCDDATSPAECTSPCLSVNGVGCATGPDCITGRCEDSTCCESASCGGLACNNVHGKCL